MRNRSLTILFLLSAFNALNINASGVKQRTPEITLPATGPYHVAENRILDSAGREFLMRGTQLVDFQLDRIAQNDSIGMKFGGHSLTVLSAIRLRFNMNTVRLPIDSGQAARPEFFPELAKVVRRANQVGLVVVLAPKDTASEDFWRKCAAYFHTNPNIMFDVSANGAAISGVVRAIRDGNAEQPVVVAGSAITSDPNVVYQLAPSIAALRTDADRDAQFERLAARAPLMATGLDPAIDDRTACAAFPSDPRTASAIVENTLDYFDAHRISWTISVYREGKMVQDLFLQDATSLENGWTCGEPDATAPGIGRLIEGHLRTVEERHLFVISAGGGFEIARGGMALGYGPVMAQRDAVSPRGSNLPKTLGGMTVRITDSAGVSRPAGIYWASAGWGQINFVIPPESATGPAAISFERWDGSRTSAQVIIADAIPGIWTPFSCVGPARGSAIQRFRDGRTVRVSLESCSTARRECELRAVPMSKGATTRVRLEGSGFRYAGSASNIEVTVGGVRVPVVSYGPSKDDGLDLVTIEIPAALRGLGETDILCRIDGRVSNAVRIRIG